MKNNIFEEFKKNKELQKIEEHKEVKSTIDNVEESIELSNNIENDETIVKENALNILYSNQKFKDFKSEFIKDEKASNLILLFDKLRSEGVEIFDNDFFIYQKMKDNNIKIVLLENTYDDIMLNKKEKIFLVKGIYPNEYQEFIREHKSREANPVKFMEFVIEKGVLFPINKDDINKSFTSGEVLSLYDTIINMSDLNKRYKIIEV